ncbi:hypothetical protein M422DRAFT_271358 [Sphaerobolus stellatus SS14]|uniref:Uncharacterized protein n=1 Tax=Sphaerobolus stellatus (strain SS14) TaxID=990650 RepID=A0A0C9U0F2_SPHS4|nr:hypothetical protein M422DRAFT_271358 [Sphaerobolus stellatus SS14]
MTTEWNFLEQHLLTEDADFDVSGWDTDDQNNGYGGNDQPQFDYQGPVGSHDDYDDDAF